MKIRISLMLLLLFYTPIYPQDNDYPVLKELIDTPTAGSLKRGTFVIGLRMYHQGGVLNEVSFGLMNRVMASVYYGGENIIGDGKINWNPQVGFEMRIRIIEESFLLPAVSLGFINQGYGGYRENLKRYDHKSKGLYIVVSRNYDLLGNTGFHIGINRSFEDEDKDKDINLFLGFDKALPGGVEFIAEYDFAFDDNSKLSYGKKNGYLSSGLRWSVVGGFCVTAIFRNLAENVKLTSGVGREIRINYMKRF